MDHLTRSQLWQWALVCAALLLVGCAWEPSATAPTICPLRALTGIPCPTCGIGRGVSATLHGDWGAVWHAHRLAPGVVLIAAGTLLAALVELCGRGHPLSLVRPAAGVVFGLALALEMVWVWPDHLAEAFGSGWDHALHEGVLTAALLDLLAGAL